jgi:hypothetical protein
MNENEQKAYIEFPANYENIVKKKIEALELDYENVIKSNMVINDEGDESSEEEKEAPEVNNMEYYQCINNDDEFIEVEEDIIIQKDELEGIEFVEKKYNSPIKNPEKIKNAMKSIKLPPPNWAKE